MSRAITVVAGVQRLRGVYASVPQVYDASIVIGESGISTGTPITLPDGQAYQSLDLELMLNGASLTPNIDWSMVGTAPRTEVSITFDLVQSDQLRFRIDTPAEQAAFVYDQSILITAGGLPASTPITLPSSRTYEGKELEIVLNGQDMEYNVDFVWIGSGDTKTQIAFLYDLYENDRVRFRIQPT